MAVCRYGPVVQAISGNVGGLTFAKAARGAVLRQRGRLKRRTSTYAQSAQTNLGRVWAQWRTLSAGEQANWEVYAFNIQRSNRVGMSDSYRGKNLFLRENLFRLAAGAPMFSTIPEKSEVGWGTLVGGLFTIGGPYFNRGPWDIAFDLDGPAEPFEDRFEFIVTLREFSHRF